MDVVYLGSAGTISTSSRRRDDAFEHDLEYGALKTAFDQAGDRLIEADWRCPLPEADLYFIRTLWDYPEHPDEFMRFIDRPELQGRLVNHPDIIRDNISKHYLKRLIKAGLPVIPSYFPEKQISFAELVADTGWQDVVVKPVIGGSGFAQHRLKAGEAADDTVINMDQFVQPFLPQIFDRGEISMVYFNGHYSHALLKTNPTGDYRIQSLFGGIESSYTPSGDLKKLGGEFISHLPAMPLAARIDFIPVGDSVQLIEMEAIEPYLYPDFHVDFGKDLHQAIKNILISI